MKVFWVVAYDQYYPSGGLGNVLETFATRKEADAYADDVTGYEFIEVHDVRHLLGITE